MIGFPDLLFIKEMSRFQAGANLTGDDMTISVSPIRSAKVFFCFSTCHSIHHITEKWFQGPFLTCQPGPRSGDFLDSIICHASSMHSCQTGSAECLSTHHTLSLKSGSLSCGLLPTYLSMALCDVPFEQFLYPSPRLKSLRCSFPGSFLSAGLICCASSAFT